jgi:hypothetical protein
MTKEELETWLNIFRTASVMGNELRSTGGQIATLVCVLLRDATAAELMRRKAEPHVLQNITPPQ